MSNFSTTARNPSPRLIITVLAFCGIVVSLMQTLIIPLIPTLPAMLDATASDASWAITGTLLAGAVVTPISGRLGDMFGKRRVLLLSLLAMVIGSTLCALSDSLTIVVAGRALQGLAMGAIPLGISIMRDLLPPEKVGAAVATMSATMGVGGAIGLPLAAFIAQSADWHMLFWAAAALGTLCLVTVWTLLPESSLRTPAKFDLVGAFGLSIGLLALLLPITKGGDWGWGSLQTIGLFAIAALVLLAWGFYEMRIGAPLVDLRVTARPQVLFTNLASVMVGFAMYGTSLIFPQLLMAPHATGYGLGQSMIMTGLALAPGGLVMMVLSPVSARLSARRGPKTTLLAGAVVIAAGYSIALFLNTEVWQVMISTMTISAGVGLAFAAMPALIMGAVPVTETGAANGLNSLMRAIGTSSSAAVMSVVLASMTTSVGATQLPTLDAFRVTFVIAISAALLAAALTAFIPRRVTPDAERPAVQAESTPVAA